MERAVQDLFNDWGGNRAGRTLAGVPGWLDALGAPLPRASHQAIGYSFEPDVRWPTHVAELKSAHKYEPLALAEVLHHAQCLSLQARTPVTPVLIASYNGWLRRSLEYLFTRGLSREHLRLVELTHLDHEGEHIIWCDEPFASWRPAPTLPGVVPADYAHGRACWYHVEETNTWYALAERSDDRPLFPAGSVACCTPLHDGSGRQLFWQGRFDGAVEDEYYLYDEAAEGTVPAPRAPFPAAAS